MRTLKYFATGLVLSTLLGMTPPIKEHLLTPPPPLFRCGGGQGNLVKCTIERKMGKKKTPVTHFFTTKSTGANSFELRIEAVLNGASSLVYNGRVTTIDKRSTDNKYIVQVLLSKKKDYSWDTSPSDALVATYDLKKKDITFETTGKMSTFYDNSHGMAAAALKSATTPPNFDVDNVIKAISAYFIMDYHKAIQAATSNKFPQ